MLKMLSSQSLPTKFFQCFHIFNLKHCLWFGTFSKRPALKRDRKNHSKKTDLGHALRKLELPPGQSSGSNSSRNWWTWLPLWEVNHPIETKAVQKLSTQTPFVSYYESPHICMLLHGSSVHSLPLQFFKSTECIFFRPRKTYGATIRT